jgi:hypothetical protein
MINGSTIVPGKGFTISICSLPAECTTHGVHFTGSKTLLYCFANDLCSCSRGNTLTGQIPGSEHGFFCQQVELIVVHLIGSGLKVVDELFSVLTAQTGCNSCSHGIAKLDRLLFPFCQLPGQGIAILVTGSHPLQGLDNPVGINMFCNTFIDLAAHRVSGQTLLLSSFDHALYPENLFCTEPGRVHSPV